MLDLIVSRGAVTQKTLRLMSRIMIVFEGPRGGEGVSAGVEEVAGRVCAVGFACALNVVAVGKETVGLVGAALLPSEPNVKPFAMLKPGLPRIGCYWYRW